MCCVHAYLALLLWLAWLIFLSYNIFFRRDDLLAILDKHCRVENTKAGAQSGKSAYDFVYLPMDFRFHLPSIFPIYSPQSAFWFKLYFWGYFFAGSFGIRGRWQIWGTRSWIFQILWLHSGFSVHSKNTFGRLLRTRKRVKSLSLSFRLICYKPFWTSFIVHWLYVLLILFFLLFVGLWDMQGKEALIESFKNRLFWCQSYSFLPAVFEAPRDGLNFSTFTTVGIRMPRAPPKRPRKSSWNTKRHLTLSLSLYGLAFHWSWIWEVVHND